MIADSMEGDPRRVKYSLDSKHRAVGEYNSALENAAAYIVLTCSNDNADMPRIGGPRCAAVQI
jgi:hypothetical protein